MTDNVAQRLLDLLDQALPAPRRGTRVLDRALASAGLLSVPVRTEELQSFVRDSLRSTLEAELGPRVASEVTTDLQQALTPALRRCPTWPSSPSSRRIKQVRHVLVVGSDRLQNAAVARALAGEGYLVSTAHDVAEMAIASAGAVPDAVVLDERCALDPPDALRDLFARRVAVVHNCSNPILAEAIVRAHGVTSVAAICEGSPARYVLRALTDLFAP